MGEFDSTNSVSNTKLEGFDLQRFISTLENVECVVSGAVGLLKIMLLDGRLRAIAVPAEGLCSHLLGFAVDSNALVSWLWHDNCIMASDVDELVVVAVLDGADRRQRPFGLPSVLVHIRHGHCWHVVLVIVEQSHDGRVLHEL